MFEQKKMLYGRKKKEPGQGSIERAEEKKGGETDYSLGEKGTLGASPKRRLQWARSLVS